MKRALLFGLIVPAVAAFFALDLDRHFTLDALRAGQAEFVAAYAARPLTVVGVFFLVYVAIPALSLLGAPSLLEDLSRIPAFDVAAGSAATPKRTSAPRRCCTSAAW